MSFHFTEHYSQEDLDTIHQAKIQARQEVQEARRRLHQLQHYEESLRTGIQAEHDKQQRLKEATANIKNEIEKDVTEAAKLTDKDKIYAEQKAANAEEVAEEKRHQAAMHEMHCKLQALEAEKKARKETMQKALELKQAELYKAWERCVEIQKKQGHELSPEPTVNGPAPSLDIDRIRARIEKERAAALQQEQAERDALKEFVAALQQELDNLLAKTAANEQKAASIRKKAQAAQKVEHARRDEYDKFLDDLEKLRVEVAEMRRFVSELEASIAAQRLCRADEMSEQEETIQQRQAELEASRAQLITANTTLQDLECEFEESKANNGRLLQEARQWVYTARAALEEAAQEEADSLDSEADDSNIRSTTE